MSAAVLELDQIQSGVLRPRPTPYVATYILIRIDERNAGRELMRRLSTTVASAAHPVSPARDTWVSALCQFSRSQGAWGSAKLAGQLSPAVPAGNGGPRQSAGRSR